MFILLSSTLVVDFAEIFDFFKRVHIVGNWFPLLFIIMIFFLHKLTLEEPICNLFGGM